MIVKQLEEMQNTGVYCIYNTKNGMRYIGSTKMTMYKRYLHHVEMLRVGKHKNEFLQKDFNEHGEDAFEFKILEVCSKDECYEREEFYINSEQNLYNISRFAVKPDNTNEYIVNKRRNTMLRKFANGELDHMRELSRNRTPWNKGMTMSEDHRKKLSIAAHNRKVTEEGKLKRRKAFRARIPEIEVYTLSGELLGTWNSSQDLQEWSLTKENNLPVNPSRKYVNGWKGKPTNYISAFHVNKACKSGKPYKGLIFKFKHSPAQQ